MGKAFEAPRTLKICKEHQEGFLVEHDPSPFFSNVHIYYGNEIKL